MPVIKLKEVSPGHFEKNGEDEIEKKKETTANRSISIPISLYHIFYLILRLIIGYYIGKKRGAKLLEDYELF